MTDYSNEDNFFLNDSLSKNLTSSNVTDNSADSSMKGFEVEYLIVCIVLFLLCIVAIIINARILICVRWIRRPLSPVLHISLSLAMADVCIAVFLALGLLINSFLPLGLGYNLQISQCTLLTIEALRLSAILITTTHLLALAGNHYLGILCPFKSMRWLTHTNVSILTTVIWIAPTIYIFGYFSSFENQGYQTANCTLNETLAFLSTQKFRKMFSAYFFIPLIIMFVIYMHISVIVKRHQANRMWYSRHSRRHDNTGRGPSDLQQQIDRNLKAIWTTLLILSTYLICFMPSVLFFCLMCEDCYFTFQEVSNKTRFVMGSTFHYLLITKPLLNPLIYASRMQEIRVALRRMDLYCRQAFCPIVSADEMERNCSSIGDGTHHALVSYVSGSTRRKQCSINSTHMGNGFSRRSLHRRTGDIATDL